MGGATVATGMTQLGTPQGNVFTLGGIIFSTCKFSITEGDVVGVTLTGIGASFAGIREALRRGRFQLRY